MHQIIDETEKQQVAEVFSLLGGELADKPLRYAAKRPAEIDTDGKLHRYWARYFYDGVPEYVEREFAKRGGSYITIVADQLFGLLPRVIYTAGKRWRKVAWYRSSGETQCPGDHDGTVKAEHCKPGEDRCMLCEEKIGEEHGYIYLGDGWGEVVYRARD